MTLPALARLYQAIEATWPAARTFHVGPCLIRSGQGGGSRVSAATADAPVTTNDLRAAEQAMQDLGQTPLFMIRAGDTELDAQLQKAGYVIKDPVRLYVAPAAGFAAPPAVTAFTIWPPLASQAEIWAKGGIGPARLAIMARAKGPRTTFLGRASESPAGTVFVACDGNIAMLHALEIGAEFRRRGLGRDLTDACARWAASQGAGHLALLCTTANKGANALYSSMGFQDVGGYHYRIKDSA